MSGFRVTVTVTETELGKVLSGFSRKQIAEADIVPIANGKAAPPVAPTKPKGKLKDSVIVMLGEGKPGKGPGQKVLQILEQLEADHGIGTVTYRLLKDACRAKGIVGQTVGAMVKNGYVAAVGE